MDQPAPLPLQSLVTTVTNSSFSISLFLFPAVSTLLLSFNSPPLNNYHPDSRPDFFFQLRGSQGCFLSIFANRREILNPRSSRCLTLSFFLSPPFDSRFFPFFFLFFSFFFFVRISAERKSPVRPGEERASVLRAQWPARNCLKIVRTEGVETDAGTLSERYPGTMKLRSDDKPISRADCGSDELSGCADAIEEENSWHAPLGSSGSDNYRTNEYRMHEWVY